MGMVFSLGDPARHFWLTRSVARSMGVNLTEAMNAGRLTPQKYAGMVTECRKCPLVAQCEKWLASCGGGASEAPESCANATALNQLRS